MSNFRKRVKLRRDLAEVKPNAEQVDGKVFWFEFGWSITADDSSLYLGEDAYLPIDSTWPDGAPSYIASGDLVDVQ